MSCGSFHLAPIEICFQIEAMAGEVALGRRLRLRLRRLPAKCKESKAKSESTESWQKI